MQKRFMAFCLSLCLLLASSASANPTQNLWDFLWDERFDITDDEVLSHVFVVGKTKEALGVAITLEGLLYDGNTFLMGWRTENLRPLDPALILYTKVTVDGEPIWTNTDHPLSYWYPRMFGLFVADDPINNLVDRFRLDTPEAYNLHGDVKITAHFVVKRPLKPLVVVDPEIHVPYDDHEDMERDRQAMISAMQACGVVIALEEEQDISEWMEKGYIVLNRYGYCLEDDGSFVDATSMYWVGDLRETDCEKQEMEISFSVDLDMLRSGA